MHQRLPLSSSTPPNSREMRILQHNCRGTYAVTIAALETALERDVDIVLIQEPYVGREGKNRRTISHPGYQLRWPFTTSRQEIRTLIVIRKDIQNQFIFEDRQDLAPEYSQCIDIWELRDRQKEQFTRLFDIYNRRLNNPIRYSLDITNWDQRLAPRTILAGDFNSRSKRWDIHTSQEQCDTRIPDFIDNNELILNNTMEKATRKDARKDAIVQSTLDLTLTSNQLGPLPHWAIEDELTTPSDHEIILFAWTPLSKEETATNSSWNLAALERPQFRFNLPSN